MHHNGTDRESELHDIVEQKLEALMVELQAADWDAGDIAAAIQQVVERRWASRNRALDAARQAVGDDFVSDGNEG